MSLAVSEIFYSIQGESTFSGLPCAFVRLAGCNLRCAWCDTRYAWEGGCQMTVEQILERVQSLDCPLVEITGGEPLFQAQTPELVRALCGAGRTVLVETNGTLDISALDPRAIRIMDVKCPSSGQHRHNDLANLSRLSEHDEIKFVIANREDYDFARKICGVAGARVRAVHFSPAWGRMDPKDLAAWMLEDRLRARLSLQLHKIVWDGARGK